MHELKTNGPGSVLAAVRELVAQKPDQPELVGHLAYLEKRVDHMQYPAFQAAGWPIGDGAVESGNKRVVQARLKGSGTHWARPHANPMLALRNIVCSDRWDEDWPQIVTTLRLQAQQRRSQRHHQRRATASPPPPPTLAPSSQTIADHKPATPIRPAPQQPSAPLTPRQPWRPSPDHPWRRMPIGRVRRSNAATLPDAKT